MISPEAEVRGLSVSVPERQEKGFGSSLQRFAKSMIRVPSKAPLGFPFTDPRSMGFWTRGRGFGFKVASGDRCPAQVTTVIAFEF